MTGKINNREIEYLLNDLRHPMRHEFQDVLVKCRRIAQYLHDAMREIEAVECVNSIGPSSTPEQRDLKKRHKELMEAADIISPTLCGRRLLELMIDDARSNGIKVTSGTIPRVRGTLTPKA